MIIDLGQNQGCQLTLREGFVFVKGFTERGESVSWFTSSRGYPSSSKKLCVSSALTFDQ
jgi:hypothetical protein